MPLARVLSPDLSHHTPNRAEPHCKHATLHEESYARPSSAQSQPGIQQPQYRLAIGSSSAGNSVITRQPLSVTTTSSSMRAAEKPSVAGQ
jgi:hypothetical protein